MDNLTNKERAQLTYEILEKRRQRKALQALKQKTLAEHNMEEIDVYRAEKSKRPSRYSQV